MPSQQLHESPSLNAHSRASFSLFAARFVRQYLQRDWNASTIAFRSAAACAVRPHFELIDFCSFHLLYVRACSVTIWAWRPT